MPRPSPGLGVRPSRSAPTRWSTGNAGQMPDALERVASDPAADAVYQQLLNMLEGIGSFTIEPGKASFLIRNGSAFLGPRCEIVRGKPARP